MRCDHHVQQEGFPQCRALRYQGDVREGHASYGSESRPAFAEIWQRIITHQGETFRQLQGGEFAYEVRGNYAVVSRAGRTKSYNIARAAFEKAYEMVPLANTLPVQGLRGPSYLYAILMDPRIRQGDW